MSKLPPLPALRDFIHIFKLNPRKVLSQNYLMNLSITDRFVREARIEPDAYVVEIGPGPGSITRSILAQSVRRCDVIEIDRRFLPALEPLAEASENRLFVHQADALKIDIAPIWNEARVPRYDWLDDTPNIHVVGNLPFKIASPLIIKYLRDMSRRRGAWAFGRVPLTLTFSLNVADRICAKVSSSERSRISVVSQYVAEPKLLFKLSGSSFTPRPKVDVGVVRFVPRVEPLIHADFDVVDKVVNHLFMYKNKTIRKSLKTLYPPEMANELVDELLGYACANPFHTSIMVGMDELNRMCIMYEKQCNRHPGLFQYYYTNKPTLEELKDHPNAIPPKYEFPVSDLNRRGVSLREFDANWLPSMKIFKE